MNRANVTRLKLVAPLRESLGSAVVRALTTGFVATVAMLGVIGLAGCPGAGCPGGEVAIAGRCYPKSAVDSVDGGIPRPCASPCTGETPYCDFATGLCIGCRTDAECPSAERATCDPLTQACVGCTSSASCARFESAPYCDGATARCTPCTAATEAQYCGEYSCDTTTGRCTSTVRRSLHPCDPCRADSECGLSQYCVAYRWKDSLPTETVCVWSTQAICATSATWQTAPFVRPGSAMTVHGATTNVCLPPSTCAAVRAYTQNRSCRYASECGSAFADSTCERGVCKMACPIQNGYAGCSTTDTCDAVFCSAL